MGRGKVHAAFSATPSPEAVRAARERISGLALVTPVLFSPVLSEKVGGEVWLKCECLQIPGSFKIRGAASKLLALPERERARGVVACSGGNHGMAVAYVAGRLGIPAVVCVPEWVDRAKLQKIRRYGAEVVVRGATFEQALAESTRIRDERALAFVHPFDDPEVVAGQGTIALEVLEQVPDVGAIVAGVSGGGLVGGIAVAAKGQRPELRVVGVSAARAAAMAASIRANHPVDVPEEPTLAEVLVGGIGQDNRWTYLLVRDLVDEMIEVEEEHIAAAMALAVREHHVVAEGGGAVGIAAALAGRLDRVSGSTVIVVSGGNVDPSTLSRLIATA